MLGLTVADLPRVPFPFGPGCTVQDAGRFLRSLQADIRRGPAGPRCLYGVLQAEIASLVELVQQTKGNRSC